MYACTVINQPYQNVATGLQGCNEENRQLVIAEERVSLYEFVDIRFPEILDNEHERLNDSYVLPDEALADVPNTLRS